VQGEKDLLGEEGAVEKEEEFAIVFAAMGVNMETAHFFKQACGEHPPQACGVLVCSWTGQDVVQHVQTLFVGL
jgi:V-type H+-transporting ATPase subunit B